MGQKTEKIFQRAKVNLEKNEHENALRLLNEVLNREPSHKKALRNKAIIKILKTSPEEAEKFLLFAIDQQPEDDQLYQLLGTFYHNNDRPKDALTQFKKALKFNEENSQVHQGLGMLYAYALGDHEQAVSHFSKTIELGNKSAEIFFNRGCSYMILNKMSKAEQDLRKATQMGHEKANEMVEKYFE